jgi:hypothetical protein
MYRTTNNWPFCPVHERQVELTWEHDGYTVKGYWHCKKCAEEEK